MTTPAHANPMTDPPDTAQPPTHGEPIATEPAPRGAPAERPTAAPEPTQPGPSASVAVADGGRPWVANALVAALTAAVTILGAGIVALLVHEFNSIDTKFAAIDARFAAIEARFVRLEAEMDARFDAQDAKIDEINLKLTALIAALNKTGEVDAALTGRLLTPDADAAAPGDGP